MGDIKKAAMDVAGKLKRNKKINTFAVSSSRSNKGFRHTSKEVNEKLGDALRKRFNWKVMLYVFRKSNLI